jgi:hypothetical protein
MTLQQYCTPSNRFPEVEREIAAALAKVSYFISPRIVRRIAELNREWKESFQSEYYERLDCGQFFYEGSACVFPGVRRRAGTEENKLKAWKYYEAQRAILDANFYPRDLWCFVCTGKPYSGPLWKDSRLGEFELAHVLPHKEYEVAGVASWFGLRPESEPSHGLFTCAANVILVPKGMAKPTDGTRGVRVAILHRYFSLYGESCAAGFGGFTPPAELSWCSELSWNDPVEPPDWEERVKLLDKFRRTAIRNRVFGKNKTVALG